MTETKETTSTDSTTSSGDKTTNDSSPSNLSTETTSEASSSVTDAATPHAVSGAAMSGTESPTEPGPKKSKLGLVIGIIIALTVAAIAYVMLFTDTGAELASKKVVARVNDAPIHRTDLANSMEDITASLETQGVDVTTDDAQDQIQSEALTRLINTELLFQAATAAGYEVADADIDSQVAQLTASLGGDEALDTRLTELSLSRTQLREDIVEQLIVTEYLQNETAIGDIAVTDEEIDEFYASLAESSEGELPPVEEIRPQIEQQLVSQKQQSILAETVAELRAIAEVETLI